VQHVVPGVARPLQILWNQVIGFFFIVLAVAAIPSVVRNFRDPGGMPRLFLSVPFVLVMAAFAVTSFLRARKINRP
jgi:hypothetical protein